MELTLVVRSGDDAGKRIPIPSGEARRVGRQQPAEVRLSSDPMLSNLHFSIECSGELCLLRDLGSKFGTLVNGRKVTEAALRNGDEILAGRTTFGVQLEGDIRATPRHDTDGEPAPAALALPAVETPPAPAPAGPLNPTRQAVVAYLRKQVNLYAVLDAAREATVIDRLKASGEQHASLYDGEEGEELSTYGPWLVKLESDKPLLEELVRDGWGRSWGVYLTCGKPFADVRRHLRKFLLVKLPDGRQVCFRYYDPRVLRTYLPTCNAEEVVAFVGPMDRYLAESVDETELLDFTANYKDWRKVGLVK
ncbi:DUF4123 domain-containing protein [Limnoglobus roseus]|uniref:FHA domain-containing protein n=1 Tax=Limnoglobus roseus TaxID=2598579 RepID=A0A5C1A996_9BACT|nr:DUF4123 domain-containing protein [Limnoglobus roseus]QEL15771.1 FHA domain-containing protein [Limnoglobus roseus]